VSSLLPEAFLTEQFVDDLKVVLGLPEAKMEQLARFVRDFAVREFPEHETETYFSEMERMLDLPRHEFSLAARLCLFLGQHVRQLPKDQISLETIRDCAYSLGLENDERTAFERLFSEVIRERERVELTDRRRIYLRSGNPRIDQVYATCDLRAIFAAGSNKDLPSLSVLDWEPVVQLELVSKLNDVTENHIFLLSCDELEQFTAKLRRAAEQLDLLRGQREILRRALEPNERRQSE